MALNKCYPYLCAQVLDGPVYRRPSMWSRQLVSASLRLGRRQFHSLLNDLTQRGFIHDITRSACAWLWLLKQKSGIVIQTWRTRKCPTYKTTDSLRGRRPNRKGLAHWPPCPSHVSSSLPSPRSPDYPACERLHNLTFKRARRFISNQIGGATGRVGDPSDRLTERHPADIRQVEENVVSLTSSMQKFFQRALYFVQSRTNFHDGVYSNPAVLSNLDWHGSFMLLDFLQKVGIHGRVNAMINRDR